MTVVATCAVAVADDALPSVALIVIVALPAATEVTVTVLQFVPQPLTWPDGALTVATELLDDDACCCAKFCAGELI